MIDRKKQEENLGRISSRLFEELRRRGVDADFAEDAVQEAWLRALRRPQQPTQLEAWMRTVARRVLLDHFRKHRCRRGHEQAAAIADCVEPSAPEDTTILAALQRLPSPYREVLELHVHEGLDATQIAARLGRSEGTVRSQLKRGRDRMREALAPDRRSGHLGLFPFLWLARVREALGRGHARSAALAGTAVAVLSIGTLLLIDHEPAARDERVALDDAPAGTAPRMQRIVHAGTRASRTPAPTSPAPSAQPPAAVLRGTVLTPDGGPAAGTEIFVGDSNGERAERVAVAGPDGTFEIPGPGERDFVWARRPGDLPSARLHTASVERGAEVELRLEPSAGPLRLRIVDECDAPLPEAEVELSWDRDAVLTIEVGPLADAWTPVRRIVATTDALGFVRLDTPDRELGRLRITPRGGASSFMEISLPRMETTALTVHRALGLVGTAVDSSGNPLPGAQVTAFQDERRLVVEARTDTAGHFTLEGLMPGSCEVRAMAGDGTGVAVEELEIAASENPRLTLQLDGRRLVRGRVLRSGVPVPGAMVALLGEDVTRCESGPDGGFALGALEDRAYAVVVHEQGAERPAWRGRDVRPGSTRLEIDLDLDGLRWETRELVLSAEPGAVLPTRIEARIPGLGHSAVFPVEGSRCRIEVLAGKDVNVRLQAWFPRHGTWLMSNVDLALPDPVPVLVPPLVEVTVVVDNAGLPLPDDLVVALREPGFDSKAWANELGSTRLRRFVQTAPGEFRLEVMPAPADSGVGVLVLASGYADLCHKPPLVGGEDVTWRVHLERGVPVDVEVPIGTRPVPLLLFRLADGTLILSGAELRRRNGVAYARAWAPPGTVALVARFKETCGVAPFDPGLGALDEPQRVVIPLDRPWDSERLLTGAAGH